MMTNCFLLLFLETFLLYNFLALTFLTTQRVNGFFLQHPSGLPMLSTRFGRSITSPVIANESLLKSSASSVNGTFLGGRLPETNSSLNENDRETCYEEIESETIGRYPWSELQQWALRDNLHKYTFRIPIKQKTSLTSTKSIDTETSAKKEEDTVLSSFALWRSLQHDVSELSGYPIDFLQARYEEIHKGKQNQIEVTDDNDGTRRRFQPPTTPGVLPFLQEYEFSARGGISGYVYGMDGVSDGSRIETSAVKNIKESLPNGYIQTSDGHASFELGNPLQTDKWNTELGTVSSISAVKEFSLETVSNVASTSTKELRSLVNSVEDDDGMLLRLGALSGVLLAGATAVNMLSHHLTVNVFWV
jgi:hypothetical protein